MTKSSNRKRIIFGIAASAAMLAAASSPAMAADKTGSSTSTSRVTFVASISINAPQSKVFSVISNYQDDLKWRIGVLKMDEPSPLKVGDTVTETAVFPNGSVVVTPTVLVKLTTPSEAVLQTAATNPTFLRNVRDVRATSYKSSSFTYDLNLDASVLEGAFPGVPLKDIVASYSQVVQQEMVNVKAQIENGTLSS